MKTLAAALAASLILAASSLPAAAAPKHGHMHQMMVMVNGRMVPVMVMVNGQMMPVFIESANGS